ncbi:DnaJ family domain-containing protein [Williamsia sp. M5A3_1d]
MAESRVDRLIREASERGDFDDLPGLGQPLDLGGLDDPDWWVKKKIRDEGLDSSALLPPTLQLRREREQYPESLRDIHSEDAVRSILTDFNRRVKRERLAPSLGPASRIVVATIDVDEMVTRWRALTR